MQKLRVLTVLLFVSIAMTFGACAEDETLNEVETTLEMKYDDKDDVQNDGGGMESNDDKDDVQNDGGGM